MRNGRHGLFSTIFPFSFTENINGIKSDFSPWWVRAGKIEANFALASYIYTKIDGRPALPFPRLNTPPQHVGVNRWSF